MSKSLLLILFIVNLLLGAVDGLGQNFIRIDKGGLEKKRIEIGDPFHFKQFNNPVLYNTTLLDIGDTVVFFGSREIPIAMPLSDIETIYVRKKWPKAVSVTTSFVGTWFLIAGLVEAIADTGNYGAGGAAIIGASLIAVGQLVRLFKWKKYGSGKYQFQIREKV